MSIFSEFRAAALSILAARGEMESQSLLSAIRTRLNINPETYHGLYLNRLVKAGEISRFVRPATIEQLQNKPNKDEYVYYQIEDIGRKARSDIAQHGDRQSTIEIPIGVSQPKPAQREVSGLDI